MWKWLTSITALRKNALNSAIGERIPIDIKQHLIANNIKASMTLALLFSAVINFAASYPIFNCLN